MLKRLTIIIPVAVAILIGMTLVVRAMRQSMVFYHPVREMVADPNPSNYRHVRLNGQVVPGTIQRDKPNNRITFVARDLVDHNVSLTVIHHGLEVPDMFKDRAEVVAEGSLTSAGTFESTFLMAKCPSKYEAEFDPNNPEIADAAMGFATSSSNGAESSETSGSTTGAYGSSDGAVGEYGYGASAQDPSGITALPDQSADHPATGDPTTE